MNKDVLDFVTFCLGAVSMHLGISRKELYAKLSKANLITDYIAAEYDVLHTFSRSYIIDDIEDMMKRKGVR